MQKLRLLAALMVASLLSPTAMADEDAKKKHHKKKATEEKKEEKEDENRSEVIREHKKFGVDVLYTPLSDYVLKYGARAYYQPSESWQFGLDFLSGSQDFKNQIGSDATGTATVTKAQASGLAAIGFARYFIGNSFSVTSGLGYRSATIDFGFADSASADTLSGTLSISSIIIPLAVGNHWTWSSGLTFGCDWIAVMIPITGSATSSTTTNVPGILDETNSELLDTGTKLAHETSLTLGLLSLGFMF